MTRDLPLLHHLTLGALSAMLLTGCSNGKVEGYQWEVFLQADIDDCHAEGEGIPYQETLFYELVFDGSAVSMYLDDQQFASGALSGCTLVYDTLTWTQDYEGYEIRWQLHGEATVRFGGDQSCDLDATRDWQGVETFTIVSSEHPEIDVGCDYILTLEGTFQGGP